MANQTNKDKAKSIAEDLKTLNPPDGIEKCRELLESFVYLVAYNGALKGLQMSTENIETEIESEADEWFPGKS